MTDGGLSITIKAEPKLKYELIIYTKSADYNMAPVIDFGGFTFKILMNS